MSQLQIMVGIYFIGAMVIIVSIWILVRDIATHNYYAKKAIDHIWVEFAPKVGHGWSDIVKLLDQKTGEFTYKDRQYFAGGERWHAMYPPGRSSLAQVSFDKCLADPASADMLTNITGKPTVSAALVYAVGNQKDTQTAMQRSQDESSGGATIKKNWIWVYIGLGIVAIIGIAGFVMQMKSTGIMQDMLDAIRKLSTLLGVK